MSRWAGDAVVESRELYAPERLRTKASREFVEQFNSAPGTAGGCRVGAGGEVADSGRYLNHYKKATRGPKAMARRSTRSMGERDRQWRTRRPWSVETLAGLLKQKIFGGGRYVAGRAVPAASVGFSLRALVRTSQGFWELSSRLRSHAAGLATAARPILRNVHRDSMTGAAWHVSAVGVPACCASCRVTELRPADSAAMAQYHVFEIAVSKCMYRYMRSESVQ